MTTRKQQTGITGEKIATAHLTGKGYTIVDSNWRCPHGEIDIIARDDVTLVFVEVRTRHSETTEIAFASISPGKQQRMIAAANAYLDAHYTDSKIAWRIDVVAVALPRSGKAIIEHVEDALGW